MYIPIMWSYLCYSNCRTGSWSYQSNFVDLRMEYIYLASLLSVSCISLTPSTYQILSLEKNGSVIISFLMDLPISIKRVYYYSMKSQVLEEK